MDGLFSLVPLIVFIPFVGVLINVFFGRKLMSYQDSKGPGVIASLLAGASFVVAVLVFIGLIFNKEGADVPFLTWINIQAGEFSLSIPWTFKVDTLSAVMMLVVTGVGTLIHIYAVGYMHGDINEQIHKRHLEGEEALDFKQRRYAKFFSFFNLFLGSMLILVTANNYLMMFVGWELVGLCSYLLIGFWFDDPLKGIINSESGMKAFVVNRIGDFGMLVAIMLIFWTFGTLQFNDVFARAECMKTAGQAECLEAHTEDVHAEEHAEEEAGHVVHELTTPVQLGPLTPTLGLVVTIITLALLLGATGKSAQIPLFVWLPDAMAGPTPVSALIHAATMVTAGIYMIARSNVLFAMAPVSSTVVAVVGGLTAFVAATIAVAQFDIKRVLAYSTISQLGFMIAAVGLGGYVAGIFHLATHAFFKALLFLSSGSVIHGLEHGHHELEHHGHKHVGFFDPQDMRFMGGLSKHMPLTTWVYTIGALTLAGIPPLAGFWSKDEILLDASRNNTLVYVLLTAAAFFTAFYMGRQIFMVFFGEERSEAGKYAHESPPLITTPLVILAVLSVIGGVMNLPFGKLHFLAEWMHESVAYAHVPEPGQGFSISVAGISTILALIAVGLSYLIYGRRPMKAGEPDPLSENALSKSVFTFLNWAWFWDEIYKGLFVAPYRRLGTFFAATIDWGFWHDFVHDSVIVQAFRGWAAILSQPIDMGVVDGAVNGIAQLVDGSSRGLRRVQTGYVRNYALAVALGVVAILIYLVIRFLM